LTKHIDYTIFTVQIEYMMSNDINIIDTKKIRFRNLLPSLMAVVLLFSVACDYAATTAPESAKASASVASETKSIADVKFRTWSPAVMEKLGPSALIKEIKDDGNTGFPTRRGGKGTDTKNVTAKKGGKVGGVKTFGNMVKVPPGAIDEKKQKITVKATCMDKKNPCSAEIEFLPSQTFLKDVEITLSYRALGYEGDPYELEIYWLQEDGTGGIVTKFTVDEEKGTVSFYVDHFTRYGWSY